MNERIFELSIQAKREFDQHVAECEKLEKQIEWVTEERLVELVVRECAGLVQGVYIDSMGYHTADQKIKDHFGVKE